MKQILSTARIAALISMVVIGRGSFADLSFPSNQKAETKIPFNDIIERNNAEREQLQRGLGRAGGEQKEAADASAKADPAVASNNETAVTKKHKDRKKNGDVIDFYNLEVGVGQAPSLVDRRYDSVGDIEVVDIKTVNDNSK